MSFIDEQNDYLRDNIDNYHIGQEVTDIDGAKCIITDISFSSLQVFIKKKTDRGINSKEWFYIKDFNKRFSTLL